ncbi:hypothetical protein ACFE04_020753 [Oxalis oulophora]
MSLTELLSSNRSIGRPSFSLPSLTITIQLVTLSATGKPIARGGAAAESRYCQGVHDHYTKRPEEIRAGDQGHMFGYATDKTPELIPLSHVLATKLGTRLTEVRKNDSCTWIRPDGKTQVVIGYFNENDAMVPIRVHTVLISTQHDEFVTNDEIALDLKEHLIKPVIP